MYKRQIHHGVVTAEPNFPGGTCAGAVWGTIWHGTLENDGFRRAWLSDVARASGSAWVPRGGAMGFRARRSAMIDALADACDEHLDVDALLDLAMRKG